MGFDGLIETPLQYWLGTDKSWDFTVYTSAQKTTIRDITGWTISFMIKRNIEDADGAALVLANGTVSGTFNASPAVNTQKFRVTLVDTDTDTEVAPGVAHWESKRTDAGFEEVLAYGSMDLRRAVHIG
jgi:hypothetical protein